MKFTISTKRNMYQFSVVKRLRRNNDNVVGYTNRCIDGKYIIFLDYDNIMFEHLINEIRHLQQMYFLGDFYIFKSSKNCFHAVCFDRVKLHYYIKIMQSSSVDPDYIRVPFYCGRKIWTLRLSQKVNDIRDGKNRSGDIQYITRLIHVSHFRQSYAHIKLINKFFNMKIEPDNPDDNKEVVLARYPI